MFIGRILKRIYKFLWPSRVVIFERGDKYISRFQTRRFFFLWVSVGGTEPAESIQACLANIGQSVTHAQEAALGGMLPRHERRRTARTLAGIFR